MLISRPVTFSLSFSLVLALLLVRPASAMPFGIMFESDANEIGGSELAFNTYQTFNDILDANATSSIFSDINVNAPFSTTGLFIDSAIGVPEPASAWLMMLAIAALWRARKSAEGAW